MANVSQPGLVARALRGVRWNYLGAVGRIAATFISQIALARLLGPEPFGLFAYAFLTVTLLGLLVEMGLQNALVQVKELDDETLAIACGRLLLTGALMATAVFLLADFIAQFVFATPRAAPVLRAMAPALLVGAGTVAATAVLTRELEFKTIQVALLGSYIVGYLVAGIGAALLGAGVWSLVIAWHVQTISACLFMLVRSPRRLRLAWPLRRLPVANFGFVVMSTHLANWVIDNGAHTAIGRWLGASTLGLYTVANNLVKVPADHLVRNIQTVLHALASRAQDNDAGLRRAYLTVLTGVGVLAFPIFAYTALMAEEVVSMLLGAKWLHAADVLVPLSVAMMLHAVEAMAGPILSGRGEPGIELRVKLVMIVLTVAVLAVTAHWSLVAVGWGVVTVYLVRWWWMGLAVCRRVEIPVGSMARAMMPPLVLAGIACAVPAAIVAAFAARDTPQPPAWLLIVLTALPTAGVIAAVVLAAPQLALGPHLLALLHDFFDKRAGWSTRPGMRRLAAQAAVAARLVATHPNAGAASWTRRHQTS